MKSVESTLDRISPFLISLFGAMFLLPAQVSAYEVHVSGTLEKERCRLGEEVVYEVVLRWSAETPDVEYRLPELPLENLDLVQTSQSSETHWEKGQEMEERVLRFKLRPRKPGRAGIGRFFIEYTVPASGGTFRRAVGPVALKILHRPPQLHKIVIGAGMVGALGFLGFLILRMKRRGEGVPATSSATIEEETLVQLQGVEGLLQEGRYQELLLKTGEVFRSYLVKKYALPPGRYTAGELSTLMEGKEGVLREDRLQLKSLLAVLTEGAFSGDALVKQNSESIYRNVIRFVEGKRVIGA